MSTTVASVGLANPVMTAAGTSGHGVELGAYLDLSSLGAVVVKSVSVEPWAGNPGPRLHETDAGMLNSVGLQNAGVQAWLEEDLPQLVAAGARVVASIWGFSADDYEHVALALSDAPPAVVAVEINLSCPNVHGRGHRGGGSIFAHSATATAEVVAATAGCRRPRWAKLSPEVADICEIAGAALGAGAEGLTLVNTLRGLAVDPETRRARLGAGAGGLSGPAIRPVAVRAVSECRRSFPDAGIVGVGGIARGVHAVEMMLVGADAVQVGTATFADPAAPARVLAELEQWCALHSVAAVADLIGGAHADP